MVTIGQSVSVVRGTFLFTLVRMSRIDSSGRHVLSSSPSSRGDVQVRASTLRTNAALGSPVVIPLLSFPFSRVAKRMPVSFSTLPSIVPFPDHLFKDIAADHC